MRCFDLLDLEVQENVISAKPLFNHEQSQGDLCHMIGWYKTSFAHVILFLLGVLAPFACRIFYGFWYPCTLCHILCESIPIYLAIRTSHRYKLLGISAR